MKGNKIAIDRYLETGEVVDSLDLSVNYLVKSVKEGGTVPAKNVITYYRVSDGDTIVDTNTNTNFTSSIFSAHSGYKVRSIRGNLYSGTVSSMSVDTSELEELYIPNVNISSGSSLFSSAPSGIKKYMDVTVMNGAERLYRTSPSGTFIRNCNTSVGGYYWLVGGKQQNNPINVHTASITASDTPASTSTYPEKIVYTGTSTVKLQNINSFRDLTIESSDSVIPLYEVINSTPMDNHRDIVHIRVPNFLVESYRMATNWSQYYDLIIPKDIDYYTDLEATAEDVYGNETMTKVWWSCTAHYHVGSDLTDRTFTLKGVSESERFPMNVQNSPISRTINFSWDGGVGQTTLNHKEHLSHGFIVKWDTPIGATFEFPTDGYIKEGYKKIRIIGRYPNNPANLRAISCGNSGHIIYSLNPGYCKSYFKKYGYLWDCATSNNILYNGVTGSSDVEENYKTADYGSLTDGQEICISIIGSSSNNSGYSQILYEDATL